MRIFWVGRYWFWVLFLFLQVIFVAPAAALHQPPSQIQVARQFLLAVLRGDYRRARKLLAAENGKLIPLREFKAVAQPLYEQGQMLKPAIALYKLGYRFSDAGTTRNFYDFSFKSDTLQPRPRVLLDVSFRDSTARQILTFGLIPAPQKARK